MRKMTQQICLTDRFYRETMDVKIRNIFKRISMRYDIWQFDYQDLSYLLKQTLINIHFVLMFVYFTNLLYSKLNQ
jgi:hypothetical protein